MPAGGGLCVHPSAQDRGYKGINKSDHKCGNQCADKRYGEQAGDNKLSQINYDRSREEANQTPALRRYALPQEGLRHITEYGNYESGDQGSYKTPVHYKTRGKSAHNN